jgi:hypothetical protein
MNLTTPVNPDKPPFDVSYNDKILITGSCFAEKTGESLSAHHFDAEVNPFGTLYNPASIAESIRRLLSPTPFTENELFSRDGLWHSWAHHSRFSRQERTDALNEINNRLAKASQHLCAATTLIITWGTAFVYRLKTTDIIVANCHKMPDSTFNRSGLSVENITADWTQLMSELWTQLPQLKKVIITVSPIRHRKDGAHNNQLSKATLLLAADNLQRSFPDRIAYFPAYEIMMDELRDYRFYADDMVHPSDMAVEYINELFRNTFFSDTTIAFFNEWTAINKALAHRPNNPNSAEYKKFLKNISEKAENLTARHPKM